MNILTQLKAWFSPSENRAGADDSMDERPSRTIEFDMMLRGNLYERPSGTVRQCSVTVNGATKLVTTGDTVTSEVYAALVQSGNVLDTEATKPKKGSTD